MSFESFQTGLINLAHDEASGEDIGEGIASLAAAAGMDPASVRQDVTEMAAIIE